MHSVHIPNMARVLMMAAALALLAGCTGGMSDLQQWVAQEKAKKGPPVPPLPVLKTFETFVYQDQDKPERMYASAGLDVPQAGLFQERARQEGLALGIHYGTVGQAIAALRHE